MQSISIPLQTPSKSETTIKRQTVMLWRAWSALSHAGIIPRRGKRSIPKFMNSRAKMRSLAPKRHANGSLLTRTRHQRGTYLAPSAPRGGLGWVCCGTYTARIRRECGAYTALTLPHMASLRHACCSCWQSSGRRHHEILVTGAHMGVTPCVFAAKFRPSICAPCTCCNTSA